VVTLQPYLSLVVDRVALPKYILHPSPSPNILWLMKVSSPQPHLNQAS